MNRVSNLYDFINRFFYGQFDSVQIVDISDREVYNADDLTVKKIRRYSIESIDGVVYDNQTGRIAIKVN